VGPHKYHVYNEQCIEKEVSGMKSVTIDQAVSDLKKMIKDSLETREEISIATSDGAVILLPQDDYESIQETLRLLMDKKSLHALIKSHEERDSGIIPDSYSIKEIFNDLQD